MDFRFVLHQDGNDGVVSISEAANGNTDIIVSADLPTLNKIRLTINGHKVDQVIYDES